MRQIELEILRYDPEQDAEPRYETFSVPCNEDWVILDAINHVKDNIDASLAYRWSCHMAVCGSCGMMVNGDPVLSCKAFLRDYPDKIRVEPLANFPIERDLIIETLHHTLGNRTHAANILGISIRTLRNKLRQYSRFRVDGFAHEEFQVVFHVGRHKIPRLLVHVLRGRFFLKFQNY